MYMYQVQLQLCDVLLFIILKFNSIVKVLSSASFFRFCVLSSILYGFSRSDGPSC